MAGERIGKTYEAILKVVLDRLIVDQPELGSVYWNEVPEGISVVPDFSLGQSKNFPSVVFLVTHYGTSGASHKKSWRNLGELCELKTFFTNPPRVYNIIFDSIMKDGMKTIQETIFDGQLIVGDTEIGPRLETWVVNNDLVLPTDQEERANAIARSTDPEIINLLNTLKKMITLCMTVPDTSISSLWKMEHAREKQTAPVAQDTHFRHGYAKRLLMGNAYTNGKVNPLANWLVPLGLAKKSIGGYKICDPDVLWFLSTPYADSYQKIISPCVTTGFLAQLHKVRSFSLIEAQCEYVVKHLEKLKTPSGMYQCLLQQHQDPYSDIVLPDGVIPPKHMWMYDFIASLIRARAGKVHAFGYSFFAHHPEAAKTMVGQATLGDWCSRFINQYFARAAKFSVPDGTVEFVALVLSEQLSNFSSSDIIQLKNGIVEQFIKKEYEATFLAHRGFDPLLAIMIGGNVINPRSDVCTIRSCFAEKAGLSGQAGKTTVVKCKKTIINWQTATDAGRDHKRKELCGRAIGLRYTWNAEKKQFEPRPGVQKLILLLDGTWRQKDLDALVRAGWDEIYYPDELDQLKKAIV